MDMFRIDDLLDFSNDEIFTSSSSTSTTTAAAAVTTPAVTTTSDTHQVFPQPYQLPGLQSLNPSFITDDLPVPSDDVAELEWLSRFVDDSFSDIPKDSIAGTLTVRSEASMSAAAARGRSKRSKATNSQAIGAAATTWTWTSTERGNSRVKKETPRQAPASPSTAEGGVRRCTHCASEKTPQWRTGPLGPKTLCNACGVRFKSGRLVPEYRPAASPTFVLTQHSNSHRKVLELRRQKEMLRQQQQQQQQQDQLYRHHRNFEIC